MKGMSIHAVIWASLVGADEIGVGAGGRVFWLLDRSSAIPLGVGEVLPASRNGPIKFNNVRFTYPSRPEVEVLKGIDLNIQPGTSMALV